MRRILLVLFVALVSVPAAAQESGQTGLTVGFPASFGLIWHASESLALRPDFSFAHTTSKSENSGSESSTNSFTVGIGALWYVGKVGDNVRTYVSPRFSYQRGTGESETRPPAGYGGNTITSETTGNTYYYSGSFGVQYSPTRRFSVYGELGIQYADADSTYTSAGLSPLLPPNSGKSTGTAFGSRAGIGLVVYFK